MGVHGLWTLISAVARPINLETMGGKKLAIDSSIWLYQFQKAMRDREGKGIANAHILGFVRRISKLLYYGIKPVFVFDGGVPTLKKQTIDERKKRKRGGQENLAKTAEKLLAAQLRQVAVKQAQKRSQAIDTGDLITKNTTYFDDSIARDFSEKNRVCKKARLCPEDAISTPAPSPEKKTRFVPRDQFQLPPIDQVPSFTEEETDHRLATEMELKQFIHEFTPEDLDINSAHFQSLSTELKYEIIGDLRIKSRQPNQLRVEAMRKTNDHEFSQAQILNLKKRNDLTQKLLTVTDMVAKANLTIPIKIAAQRNKEYVLVKASEGWILGIENEKQSGTENKNLSIDAGSENANEPIEQEKIGETQALEQRNSDLSDSDDGIELEEVIVTPNKPTCGQRDADLVNAIRFHYGTKNRESVVELDEAGADEPKDGHRLFQQADEEDEVMRDIIAEVAIEGNLNQTNKEQPKSNQDFAEASSTNVISNKLEIDESGNQGSSSSNPMTSKTEFRWPTASKEIIDNFLNSIDLEVDDEFLIPSSVTPTVDVDKAPKSVSSQDLAFDSERLTLVSQTPFQLDKNSQKTDLASGDNILSRDASSTQALMMDIGPPIMGLETELVADDERNSQMSTVEPHDHQTKAFIPPLLGKKHAPTKNVLAEENGAVSRDFANSSKRRSMSMSPFPEALTPQSPLPKSISQTTPLCEPAKPASNNTDDIFHAFPAMSTRDPSLGEIADSTKRDGIGNSRQEISEINVLESPGTTSEILVEEPAQALGSDEEELHRAVEDEEREIDENLALEADQWNEFLSGLEDQEKLEKLGREAESEVRRLKEQRVKDRRDADDVNLQMSQDIQNLLKLFGIPYVVSPMEAEAQCSELLKLKLVDGIITDDSDVFLFGGHKVYKNLFNQNKFVECYLLHDLEQELGLNQQKLIQLAFLLGSDYTSGLNGVGPVTAMEILSEFDQDDSFHPSGHDNQNANLTGLVKFKNWWQKVQVGKDTELESGTSFRKKFRKKKDKIWIDENWPNSTVAEAYLHPIVDHSTENFAWGLPDLDGIREFLYDHLTWSSTKTDELIVPLIKRQTQRSSGTIQTQGVLDDFFDYSIDTNTSRLAPSRINAAFSSQRLQKIVKSWREKKKHKELENEKEVQQSTTSTESRISANSTKKAKPVKQKPRSRKNKETGPEQVELSSQISTRSIGKQKQVTNESKGTKRKSKNQSKPSLKKPKKSGRRLRKDEEESTTSISSIASEETKSD